MRFRFRPERWTLASPFALAFALIAVGAGEWGLVPLNLAILLAILAIAISIINTLRRTRRQISSISTDIAAISDHVRHITAGNFAEPSPLATSSQVRPLRRAVDAMTSQLRQTVEELQEIAQRDPLTGLPNRSHFQRTVERQLAAAGDGLNALLFIDIDQFKQVNDTLGHRIGDQILQLASERLKLATRLSEHVRETDGNEDDGADGATANSCLSRLGGDEFTVFLPRLASETVVRRVAARVLRVLSEPFELGSHTITVGASIGVAIAPRDGQTYDQLLRTADTAMYHAKRQGRNRIEFYCSALDEEALRASAMEQELREALAENQFELHFQPLYDCRTLRISSAEALIRWNHPKRGLILPGAFIPLAEKINLINQIGEWVTTEAIQRIAEFKEAGMPLRISVNVSPNQLRQMEFIALVKASLSRWNAPPELLELEITESVAMQDVDLAADRLARIRALGVSVAMDDFGTGYSNLASLIRLPFTRLKLDRSLLTDLLARSEARTLVQTIISMASGLGFQSVAEGVETRDQLDLLGVMQCDVVQGFLLSRPVPAEALAELLRSEISKPVNHYFAKAI